MKGSSKLGGWRGTLTILVGVFIGAGLVQPALAHLGTGVHKKHADARYWNTTTEQAAGDVTGLLTNLQLGASSVGANEIAAGAVGSSEIGTGAVDSDEIAAGAVGSSEIDTSAVGSDEIAAGAVGGSELGAFTTETSFVLVEGGVFNGAYNTASVTERCDAGQVMGGGAFWTDTANNPVTGGDNEELFISESHFVPAFLFFGPGWTVTGGNDSGVDRRLHVEVYCLG